MKTIALLLLLMLTGCSKLSIGLRFADNVAMSYVDDYFELNSKQRRSARDEFNAALKDVRRNDFPKIASMLDGVADEVEKKTFTEARLVELMETIKTTLNSVVSRFEPMLQQVIAEQALKDFSRFDKEFAARQNERSEKMKSEKDRLKVVQKRVKTLVDETLGDLTKEQQAWLDELSKESPLVLEQESRQSVFENFKIARATPETRAPFVRDFLTNWEAAQTPAYRAARAAYQTKSIAVIFRIFQSADADQKKNLIENFRKRAGEFRTLSVVD